MVPSTRSSRSRGFTLIEVLIVVAILGLLASVVVAQFVDATGDAEKQAFISSGRAFSEAAMRFQIENGAYPSDVFPGTLPAGFGDYVTYTQWEAPTPIGGRWDTEDDYGISAAVGVCFTGAAVTRDDAYMQEIDAAVDDGDLSTGFFRKLAAERYYWVLAD